MLSGFPTGFNTVCFIREDRKKMIMWGRKKDKGVKLNNRRKANGVFLLQKAGRVNAIPAILQWD
jgi:hypothetical protein